MRIRKFFHKECGLYSYDFEIFCISTQREQVRPQKVLRYYEKRIINNNTITRYNLRMLLCSNYRLPIQLEGLYNKKGLN